MTKYNPIGIFLERLDKIKKIILLGRRTSRPIRETYFVGKKFKLVTFFKSCKPIKKNSEDMPSIPAQNYPKTTSNIRNNQNEEMWENVITFLLVVKPTIKKNITSRSLKQSEN